MADPNGTVNSVYLQAYAWEENVTQSDSDIYAFCLDRDSNSVMVRIHGFYYTMYIQLPEFENVGGRNKYITWDIGKVKNLYNNILDRIPRDNRPIDVRFGTKSKLNYYMGSKTFHFIKIYCTKKSDIMLFKSRLSNPINTAFTTQLTGFVCYEHDVENVRKFLTERNMNHCQWFRIDGCENILDPIKLSTCKYEYHVYYDKIIPINEVWRTYPTILSFDFEVFSHKKNPYSGEYPFPTKYFVEDVIFIVSVIIQKSGKPETRRKYSIIYGDTDHVTTSDETIIVHSEFELLYNFCKLFIREDPEIVTGYNIFLFDWDYFYVRAAITGLSTVLPNMSRLKRGESKWYTKPNTGDYKRESPKLYMFSGRIALDMYIYVKKIPTLKPPTYKLNDVAKELLGKEKHDVKPKEMFEAFAAYRDKLEGAKSMMARILAYCIQDSDLVLDMFEKCQVWIAMTEMGNILGVPPEELYLYGVQNQCFSMVYDVAAKFGYVVDKRDVKMSFSGGAVADPETGLHDIVSCFDFAGLYPSIIMAYNICYSTLVPPDITNEIEDEKCHIINGTDNAVNHKDDSDNSDTDSDSDDDGNVREKTTKHGDEVSFVTKFVKNEVREGVLPKIEKHLTSSRAEVKKLLKNCKDEFLSILYDQRQNAMKLGANGLYGFLNPRAGGKLPLPEGSRVITYLGRKSIETVQNEIMKYSRVQKLIYGDTDSCMVSMSVTDTDDKTLDEYCEYMSDEISKLFPKPMKLTYEKSMVMLSIGKKMYAYLPIKNGVVINKPSAVIVKGIAPARSDKCLWLNKVYKSILFNILNKGDFLSSLDILLESVYNLYLSNVSLKELRTIRRMGAAYKKSGHPMKIFDEYLRSIGKPANPGDQLETLIIKDEKYKNIGPKIRLLDDVKSVSELDIEYYMEKVLKNPINTLFMTSYKDKYPLLAQYGIRVPGKRTDTQYLNVVSIIIYLIHEGHNTQSIRGIYNELINPTEFFI